MSGTRLKTTPSGIAAAPSRSPSRLSGVWWLWIVTCLAFPPAGYIGRAVAGPVDGLPSAVLAGVVTGIVLGVLQWALLRRRGASAAWILGTAAGFGVGLAAGAALVSYRTDRPALAIMGAVSGLAVGVLQAKAIGATARQSLVWGGATAGLWAVAWMPTSGVIDVTDQWPVFGISGALGVVFVQCLFIMRVLPIAATPVRGDQSR
jgi:hypothetical protein